MHYEVNYDILKLIYNYYFKSFVCLEIINDVMHGLSFVSLSW